MTVSDFEQFRFWRGGNVWIIYWVTGSNCFGKTGKSSGSLGGSPRRKWFESSFFKSTDKGNSRRLAYRSFLKQRTLCITPLSWMSLGTSHVYFSDSSFKMIFKNIFHIQNSRLVLYKSHLCLQPIIHIVGRISLWTLQSIHGNLLLKCL